MSSQVVTRSESEASDYTDTDFDFDTNFDLDSPQTVIQQPPLKKQKTGLKSQRTGPKPKKVVKGKRGILKDINESPLDIVFEIFMYLEPFDLLRISRTSKDLRNLLLRESSLFIWKQARENIEFPEPPWDLTEPQFASLAFDTFCHASPSSDEQITALFLNSLVL